MVEKKDAAVRRLNRLVDYKRTFSTESGKRVLKDLMESHWVLAPVFAGPGKNDETNFKDGERNVILRILKILKMDVVALQKYIEEVSKNESTEQSSNPVDW